MTDAPSLTEPKVVTDGRRLRTADSRARIIAAMLDLARSGHITFSAELVAEHAGVGLRTVFRHFKDMDSLYRERSLVIEASLRDELLQPFKAADWRGQLSELMRRRAAAFEKLTPFKRAEAAHRHRSQALEQDIQRMTRMLRDRLKALLVGSPVTDPGYFESLDLLLSFESWQRLRREQELSFEQAQGVLGLAVDRLLAGL